MGFTFAVAQALACAMFATPGLKRPLYIALRTWNHAPTIIL
jgi:hypothetical protein